MIKSRFRYLKLTAVVAVLAIVTAWSVSASMATSSPARTNALPDVNIASELGTLDSFGDDLAKFEAKRAKLAKKSSLTSAEFNLLKNDHDALKQRVSRVSDAIRSIINKLKAAGRWDNFDEELLAGTTDAKFKASVAEFGGAKRLFEDGATELGSSAAKEEILGSLDDVQKKVAGQVQDRLFERRSQESEFRMVAAAYNPAEPMFKRTVGCILATIHYGAAMVANSQTKLNADNSKPAANYSCKCHGAGCPGAE